MPINLKLVLQALTWEMATIDSASLQGNQEDQLLKLRKELKEWERAFSVAHEGRKAGREDIKQHPDIGLRNGLPNL